MRRRHFLAASATALLLWPATPRATPADPITQGDAGDRVPGRAGLTYLDLVRQAVPDLALSPEDHRVEGHLATSPRALSGGAPAGAPDHIELGAMEAVRIRSGGKPRLVLLAAVGPDPDHPLSVILLFDDSGASPILLDVAEVGVDRFTSFHDQPPLPLGPGDDALVTASEHETDDQAFTTRLLVFIENDRFQLIDRFSLLADSGCNWSRTETPVFSTHPLAGAPYAEIDVTVTETLLSRPDTCGHAPKPIKSAFLASWRWDPASSAFIADRGALDDLAKLNATRF